MSKTLKKARLTNEELLERLEEKIDNGQKQNEAYTWRVVNIVENNLIDKLVEHEKKEEERYEKLITHLVDIAGKFKKFDEEQTVLSANSSQHSDRIEKLEKVVFKPS
jgi:uncharacterized protein YceH (UPF0502 family)